MEGAGRIVNQQELLAEVVSDPLLFIPTFYKIENKEREEVPFLLNDVQQDVLGELWTNQVTRANVLKASQLGLTSAIMALFLYECITIPGTVSVVVAHEEFITQRLLNKAQTFYDSIPDKFKPEMHHRSSYEKTFPDINSTMYIGSARAYVFGRGETIHNFLASEYAFWPDPERIMVPTMQRVPITGRIVKESTPNGEENAFAWDWTASKRGEEIGKAVFKNLFYPWWLEPAYSLPQGSRFALECDRGELDFTEEEESLIRKHNLTEDRIRWRRRKVQEMEDLRLSGESRKFFFQEYPEDDVNCFIAVGDMVYDSETLKKLAQDCYRANTSFENFQVWYPPEEGIQYLVSVDPSQAKESKTAITVWRFKPEDGIERPVECARFSGLVGPEITAEKAKKIGHYYNKAEIVVEANSHGLAVVTNIKSYPNLYYRRDVVSGRTSKEIGWLTTPRTKPYMVQSLQKALPNMITHDIDLIVEMRNMRWVGDKVITLGDDDIHDTAAIAQTCHSPRSGKRGYAGSAGWKRW